MISVRFQGNPFNITVIQVCAPTANAKEAEVEWFYEDLQNLLELTPIKDVLFIIGDWDAKVRPITSWQTDGRTMETMQTLFSWALKSLWMVTVTMKLKDACSLEE